MLTAFSPEADMYRKISGAFDSENTSSPVTFLPEFKVWYCGGVITVFKASPLWGTPWPCTARQRRIIQALNENDPVLMNRVVPAVTPRELPEEKVKMEIRVSASAGAVNWGFEFDSGMMKIFDGRGMEVEFSGDREHPDSFMFRGKRIESCRITEGSWQIREKEGIFCCSSGTDEKKEPFDGIVSWERAADKKHAWWNEAFLLTRHLAGFDEAKRLELLTAVQQLLMFPEESFYFDGNFSSWCSGMRKLKFAELLKMQLMKICASSRIWRYNAKCFTGIDDGVRLPGRSDCSGNPLELDWLGALDAAPSCLTAIEMFEYCNEMHDMDFLREYAFDFMKQVMQVVELSIVPEDFKLAIPRSPLPGGKRDSLAGCGKNADRQLYYIHALCKRLLKACDMLGLRADPVWRDIEARLPQARGTWQLAPDTSWGKAGKTICALMH